MAKNNSSCAFFEDSDLRIIGLAQVGGGSVSVLGCIIMLTLILAQKRFKTTTQRLLLYINLSILIASIVYVVRGAGYGLLDNQYFCTGIAYINQFCAASLLAVMCCFLLHLFLKAIFVVRIKKMEILYIPIIFILPLLVSAIPFIKNSYGKAGPWCWIQGKEGECELFEIGMIMQYSLWYGPLYTLIIIGAVIYVISILILKKKLREQETRYTSDRERQKQQMTLRELNHFCWYPIILFFFSLVPLATHISDNVKKDHALVPLWTAAAVIQSLEGFAISIIFIVRKCFVGNNRNSCKQRCCCCFFNRNESCVLVNSPMPTMSPEQSYEDIDKEIVESDFATSNHKRQYRTM